MYNTDYIQIQIQIRKQYVYDFFQPMCCSKSDYYVRTLKLIENGFEPEEAKISGRGAKQ